MKQTVVPSRSPNCGFILYILIEHLLEVAINWCRKYDMNRVSDMNLHWTFYSVITVKSHFYTYKQFKQEYFHIFFKKRKIRICLLYWPSPSISSVKSTYNVKVKYQLVNGKHLDYKYQVRIPRMTIWFYHFIKTKYF